MFSRCRGLIGRLDYTAQHPRVVHQPDPISGTQGIDPALRASRPWRYPARRWCAGNEDSCLKQRHIFPAGRGFRLCRRVAGWPRQVGRPPVGSVCRRTIWAFSPAFIPWRSGAISAHRAAIISLQKIKLYEAGARLHRRRPQEQESSTGKDDAVSGETPFAPVLR